MNELSDDRHPAQAPIPVPVRRQAAAWLVELQADDSGESTRARWHAWRNAHPDHDRAWRRIEAMGDRLQSLSSPLAHAALTAPRSQARRRAVKSLAVLLFAGGSAWLAREQTPWPVWTADYRTRIGERSELTLADGTRVVLNADSAIDVRYTGEQRLVRLLAGEVLIATAPDPLATPGRVSRPFLVQTTHGRLRALGTRFSVRQRGGRSDLAVYEGAVEIRVADASGIRVVNAGEQTWFTRDQLGPILVADENATSWTEGIIVAQDMPLADFLTELRSYRSGRLDWDAEVLDLKVTGTYPLADTDKVLDMLRTTLPVEMSTFTRYWVTVQRRRRKV